MTPAEETVKQLRDQYYSLHNRLEELLDACGNNDELKREVGDIMDDALTNYLKAQNRIFSQNASTVTQLQKKVGTAQTSITQALADLKKIKSVLDTLVKVVKTIGIAVSALKTIP